MKQYKYTATTVWGRQVEFISSNWPESDKIFNVLMDNDIIKETPKPKEQYSVVRNSGPLPQSMYVYEKFMISDEGTTQSNGRLICTIAPNGEV